MQRQQHGHVVNGKTVHPLYPDLHSIDNGKQPSKKPPTELLARDEQAEKRHHPVTRAARLKGPAQAEYAGHHKQPDGPPLDDAVLLQKHSVPVRGSAAKPQHHP